MQKLKRGPGRPRIYEDRYSFTITGDQKTFEKLRAKARGKGKSVSEYLRPTLERLANA